MATLPSLQLKDVRISEETVHANERMLTGGFYAEVELAYDPTIAQENNGRPFGIDSLREIQLSAETRSKVSYARSIAGALRAELGDTHRAVKIVIAWTGANERTVKNWFAGVSGPSGDHLVAVIRHSDDVLEALMLLAGRKHAATVRKLVGARDTLVAMLEMIVDLTT